MLTRDNSSLDCTGENLMFAGSNPNMSPPFDSTTVGSYNCTNLSD